MGEMIPNLTCAWVAQPPTRITGNNHHPGQVSNFCRQISVDLELKLTPDYYAKWWKDASWTERKSMLVGVDWAKKKRVPQFSNSKILGSDSIDKSNHLCSLEKKGWVEDIQRKQTMICNMYVWSFCCKIFFPKTIHPFFNKKVWETNPRTEGKGSGGWVDVIHTTTQDEAEDPKKKAAANSSKGKNGKMEGWWRVTFEWWEQRKFDTNLWLDVDVLLDFFCWEQKGGRFCWSVKIGVIHVTTCQPGKRQLWRRSKDGCPQYDYRGLTHLRQLSLLQDKNKAPADPTKDRSLSVCRLGYFSCNFWFV